MHRRAFLTAGGAGALGFAASACASRSKSIATTPRKPPLHLAPVNASWDRVIRTTVGLRPHRDAGFVLKAEKLDGIAVTGVRSLGAAVAERKP